MKSLFEKLQKNWETIHDIVNISKPAKSVRSFFEKFENHLFFLKTFEKLIIVCGDFNIDSMKTDCINRKELLEIAESYNLRSKNDQPTRFYASSSRAFFFVKIKWKLVLL